MRIGGVSVDIMPLESVEDVFRRALLDKSGPCLCLASANLDHVVKFGGAAGVVLEDDTTKSWLILPDGMPIVWMASFLSRAFVKPQTGADLLPQLLTIAGKFGANVGFLGGSADMHARLGGVMLERFPDLSAWSFWAPERATLESYEGSRELAMEIASRRVDLLVVALTKPFQETWIAQHVVTSRARVALAFGAASDFLAGTQTRAPAVLRHLGLEWLYRLYREPRRLARRYLVQGPRGLWYLLTRSG